MRFRLLCVRHGRTAWNASGRFQGQSDIPLDNVGREQALQTKAFLAPFTIDHVVCSDLSRALETANSIVGDRKIEIVQDIGLRERNFGNWEGLTWVQIVERHPELANETILNARVFEPPNGENFSTAITRAMQAYERLQQRIKDGQTALLVAHAGILHALLDGILGPERDSIMIMPASVMGIDIDGKSASLSERDRFAPSHT
jgi:broad specificity phosphatase PhoE